MKKCELSGSAARLCMVEPPLAGVGSTPNVRSEGRRGAHGGSERGCGGLTVDAVSIPEGGCRRGGVERMMVARTARQPFHLS
jgi:hypothetical protein